MFDDRDGLVQGGNVGDLRGALFGEVDPDGETKLGRAELRVESVRGGEVGAGDKGDVVLGRGGVFDLSC